MTLRFNMAAISVKKGLVAHVAAGREGLARAGEHQGPHRGLAVGLFQGGHQLGPAESVQWVEKLGLVEGQHPDRAVILLQDSLVLGHENSLGWTGNPLPCGPKQDMLHCPTSQVDPCRPALTVLAVFARVYQGLGQEETCQKTQAAQASARPPRLAAATSGCLRWKY